MKTDRRDEGLGDLLDLAVRGIEPDSAQRLQSVLRRGARRRGLRLTSALATVAVFVGAVGWGAIQMRSGNERGTVRFGSLGSEGYALVLPGSWHVQRLGSCGIGRIRGAGVVVSNVAFTFQNPDGRPPGCEDRLVLAGFPRNGIAVAVLPVGMRIGLSSAVPDATPFPISMQSLIPTGGVKGGPAESYLPLIVDGELVGILRTYMGPASSSRAKAQLSAIVGSLRVRGAADWTRDRSDANGFTVDFPQGWEPATATLTPSLTDPHEIIALGTYPLRPGGPNCAQFPVNAIQDLGSNDALIWIAERTEVDGNAPPRPATFETLLSQPDQSDESAACLDQPKSFSHWYTEFSDGDRTFGLYLAFGVSASTAVRSEAFGILDNMRFDAAQGSSGRGFPVCPSLTSALPLGPRPGPDARATARRFVRAWNQGDRAVLRALSDRTAVENGVLRPRSTSVVASTARRPVIGSTSAGRDVLVLGSCGQQVAARTWRVTVDDGSSSASADYYLYLIRTADGWKVWAAY